MGVLDPTYRILHGLLHSEFVDRNYLRGNISLRFLHELAWTLTLDNPHVDWTSIRQVINHSGKSKILCASLYLSHRLFGSPLPKPLRPTFAAITHYARSRLQVHWEWTGALIDRLLWFSAQDICERYQCDNDFLPVAARRIQLATTIAWKKGKRLFRWARRQLGERLALRL
jgi:hypothetical protein